MLSTAQLNRTSPSSTQSQSKPSWFTVYQSYQVTEELVHSMIDGWDNFLDCLKIRSTDELSREWFVIFRKYLGERKGRYKTIARVELHEEILSFIMNTRCPLSKESVLEWNILMVGYWIHQRPHLMPLLGIKSPNSIHITKLFKAMTSIHQVAKKTDFIGVMPHAIDNCILTWCTTGGTVQ